MDIFEINELVYHLIQGSDAPISIYKLIALSGRDRLEVERAIAILKLDEKIASPAPGMWQIVG